MFVMIKPGSVVAASPGPRGLGAQAKEWALDSQRLPDIPGPPDRDLVEEWLETVARQPQGNVFAGQYLSAIAPGSAL
jgi:hypothetical protein